MLRNFSIKNKLFSMVLLALLALGTNGLINYRQLVTVKENWNNYTNQVEKRQKYLLELRAQFGYGGAIHNFKNYVLRSTDNYVERFKANHQTITDQIMRYYALEVISKEETEALSEIQATADKYRDAVKVSQEMRQNGNSIREIDKVIKIDDNPALKAFEVLEAEYTKLLSAKTEAISEAVRDGVKSSVASASIGTAIIALISLLIGNGIARSINRVVTAVQAIAQGNLTTTVAIRSHDELGTLAKNVNIMTGNIRSINEALEAEKRESEAKSERLAVEKSEADRQSNYLASSVEIMLETMTQLSGGDLTVKLPIDGNDEIAKLFSGFNEAIGKICRLMEQVVMSVESTTSAATEIGSSTEEIATGSRQQSDQTKEVAGAMEEMNRSITENSRNAHATAEVAEQGGKVAVDGGEIVRQTVDKMREIAAVVQNSSMMVEQLGASSTKIGVIVSEISEIADQTNLLALNAAIEAARAGEQGQGFAVVADEVRKLAERTTQSTKVIAETIESIQRETREAVEAMKRGTSEVTDGIRLADQAGDALDQIVRNAQEVVELVRNIATASEEQSMTSAEVAKNIDLISGIVSESAGGLSQIAKSTETLAGMAIELQNLTAQFQTQNRSIHTLNS